MSSVSPPVGGRRFTPKAFARGTHAAFLVVRRRAERFSYVISGYGTAAVATTCCCWLAGLEPSLNVLTKLNIFVDPLVILPK